MKECHNLCFLITVVRVVRSAAHVKCTGEMKKLL